MPSDTRTKKKWSHLWRKIKKKKILVVIRNECQSLCRTHHFCWRYHCFKLVAIWQFSARTLITVAWKCKAQYNVTEIKENISNGKYLKYNRSTHNWLATALVLRYDAFYWSNKTKRRLKGSGDVNCHYQHRDRGS